MAFPGRTGHLRLAIEILSDKWRISLLHLLLNGPLRTWQIREGLGTVSPKVLTQTLRGLERDGLIVRQVFPKVPPRVEYYLSEIAKPLISALDELCLWSESYGENMLQARSQYDLRSRTTVPGKTSLRLSQIIESNVKKGGSLRTEPRISRFRAAVDNQN
jgi:DNA-binding HxlR family transcriptional regulator